MISTLNGATQSYVVHLWFYIKSPSIFIYFFGRRALQCVFVEFFHYLSNHLDTQGIEHWMWVVKVNGPTNCAIDSRLTHIWALISPNWYYDQGFGIWLSTFTEIIPKKLSISLFCWDVIKAYLQNLWNKTKQTRNTLYNFTPINIALELVSCNYFPLEKWIKWIKLGDN